VRQKRCFTEKNTPLPKNPSARMIAITSDVTPTTHTIAACWSDIHSDPSSDWNEGSAGNLPLRIRS
jgi:hypothetical protein